MANTNKTRLQEIAEQTGLSVSSVSRALRNSHQISDAKKRLVLETARKLDYRFHLKRPSPSFMTISVYAGDVDLNAKGSIYREMMESITDEAALHNCRIIPIKLNELKDQIKSSKNRFESLILLGFDREEHYEALSETGQPIVLANSQDVMGRLDSVLPDTYGCGVLVARYLEENAYKSTLHITHQQAANRQRETLARRMEGYYQRREKSFAEPPRDHEIDPGSYEEYELKSIKAEIAEQLRDLDLEQFDSVVCWGMVMKLGLEEVIPDISHRLPVLLVGYSEEVEKHQHDGPIVCLPAATIGRQAVQQLVLRQFYPEAPTSRTLISVKMEHLRKICVEDS